jgi:hypothetical protein
MADSIEYEVPEHPWASEEGCISPAHSVLWLFDGMQEFSWSSPDNS